jgi:hypothetical protein
VPTCIERSNLAQGCLANLSASTDALQVGVVGDHDHTVARPVQIDLDHVGLLLDRKAVGRCGVFRTLF